MRRSHATSALLAALLISGFASAQSGCEGDINGDGQVNGVDLAVVLTSWGPCTVGASIDGVYPSSGPVAGGTPIAIVGVDLGATASVTVDGLLVPKFNVASATTVTAITPAGTLGPKTLVLRNSQGQQIASTTFTYAPLTVPWATVLEHCPNPAVVTDSTLRDAIAATGLPWRVRDNETGIEMLLITPGIFEMGCSPSDGHNCDSSGIESPVHTVTLTNAFYLGRYEVTQAQWQLMMGSNPSSFQRASAEVAPAQVPNRPVETVSWNTIQGFLTATGLRLPTEAEWEYAYRAGTTTAFHGWTGQPAGTNNDSLVINIAWYSPTYGGDSMSQTHPVGLKAANGFGLHDMAGNADEWVNDWFGSTYYVSSPSLNPGGPTSGANRGLRGGGWDSHQFRVRSSRRGSAAPAYADGTIGFRVARNP